ncbi:MAG TPA: PH domain-containing protein, partial [Chitinophagaceae bacterium]|nr:PH domain-containing protein [Chitinophagaceae bacterium]
PFLLYYFFKNKSGSFDSFELMIVGLSSISLIGSVLEFIYFRFYIQENDLIIKSGFISKKTVTIPLSKIQAVHIDQPLLHNLLNAARLSFDSAGSEKIEVKIDAINTREAEDLKRFILHARPNANEEPQTAPPPEQTIIDLDLKDLFKLSISANHLEAFLLMLAFFVSIIDQVKGIFDVEYGRVVNWVYGLGSSPLAALFAGSIAALLVSVIISSVRVFLRYFDFRISKSAKGYLIHSGLINIQQKLVPFNKIQFISWKANWIRQYMKLYLLHFHAIGYGHMKERLRIKVPITKMSMLPVLLQQYHPLLPIENIAPIRVQSAFIARRTLIMGLIPAVVLGIIGFIFFDWIILWYIFGAWVALVAVYSFLFQRKFRLWMSSDALQIKRGYFGREELVLKWNMVQSVVLDQSIYQRSHHLASIVLNTAGGKVRIPYIPLDIARKIVNYALYKTGSLHVQ